MKKHFWIYSFLLILTFSLTLFAQQADRAASNVVFGKAKKLTRPPYPPAARAVKASGFVLVNIIADENGEVIYAQADAGFPSLRDAALEAARTSKLTPSLRNGEPVKVFGIIAYKFMPPENVEIQIVMLKTAEKLTTEQLKEIKAGGKYQGAVAEMVKALKQENADLSKFDFVSNGKVEVKVYLKEGSPAALDELTKTGFEVTKKTDNNKKIQGIIAVEKLTALAELENVMSIEPR